jgi:hypothetical protein
VRLCAQALSLALLAGCCVVRDQNPPTVEDRGEFCRCPRGDTLHTHTAAVPVMLPRLP